MTLVAALPDTIATESPLIGYFRDDGIVSTWGRDGSWCAELGAVAHDLMPSARTVWINVYKDGYCALHNTEEKARHCSRSPDGTIDPTFSHVITTEIPTS